MASGRAEWQVGFSPAVLGPDGAERRPALFWPQTFKSYLIRSFPPMRIHSLSGGPVPTHAYLLTDSERGEAVLIDAPAGIWAEVEPILKREQCRLTELWITHGHWDHTIGGAEVGRGAAVWMRALAADRILLESPQVMRAFSGGELRVEPLRIDAWVEAGEKLAALGTEAEVRHVPGHCPGNVLFHFPAAGAAFVGDALFKGSIGRTDLPGGDFEVLARSIREQIYSLPDPTRVLAGHGPETTVGAEKSSNPYVRHQA